MRLISRLRFVELPKDCDRRVEDFVDGYRGAVDFFLVFSAIIVIANRLKRRYHMDNTWCGIKGSDDL